MRTAAVLILALVLAAAGCAASTSENAAPDTSSSSAPDTSPSSALETAVATAPESGEGAAPREFAALNAAEGYGFLQVMTLEERPDSLDIVIYESLPNELPRVAGVITSVAQSPLSHVNLRAIQDGVPNAYIEHPLTDPDVASNIGRYVRYVITENGYLIEPATQEQVEAHHVGSRPGSEQIPGRDLTITEITPLAEIGFEDWPAFGVKAANLATLGSFDLPNVYVPTGYGVPFSFYDEFMRANGFYEEVAGIIADQTLADDQRALEDRLAQLREDIKDAPMSNEAIRSLTEIQASFPVGQGIRCRSSTNNEDLPNFSGAGLYDSYTQHPEEGHLSKCIKQVFASTWNPRAYLAREFHRIDHMSTAMGVLLHPNFENELANGVAVTTDPIYYSTDAYYVNTQLGEDLVTNPEALSLPETLFLEHSGGVVVITYSNLVEPGELLLADSHLDTLRSSLAIIHAEFADLYGAEASELFAMEVEFKVTELDQLAIKQARPWVFN